ncbi:hypothetical protein ABPG75_004245 [Micractinium tetrahymenae]
MDAARHSALVAAAAADLAGAAALRAAAGSLLGSRQRGTQAGTAYLSVAAVTLLAGSGCLATSMQNAALLAAAAAALAPNGALLSAVLLAAGGAGWLPGAVLLAVPLGLIIANHGNTAGGSSDSGSACASDSSASLQPGIALRRLAGYLCCFAGSAAALAHAGHMLPPSLAAAVGLAGGHGAAPAVSPTDLAADPLAWVGARVAQQQPHLGRAAVLPAASLEPGLGLQWYLLAQSFPQFRAFFLYTSSRWHRPSRTDNPRCVAQGLLPLAGPHLSALQGALPWLGLALAAALLLSESAAGLWLGGGGGNANFLYGMNLLWAGLQAVLLLRLLRVAAAAERPAAPGAAAAGS